MKRIIYSGFLKFIAVVLFISSIVAGTLVATNGIIEFFDEKMHVYSFEDSFEESSCVSSMLSYPEDTLMSVYDSFYREFDGHGIQVNIEDDREIDPELVKQRLEEWLSGSYYSDKIRYYVQWDDIVITNCGAESPEELMNGEFYSYVKREGLENIEREISTDAYRTYGYSVDYLTGDYSIVISCNIREEVVNE